MEAETARWVGEIVQARAFSQGRVDAVGVRKDRLATTLMNVMMMMMMMMVVVAVVVMLMVVQMMMTTMFIRTSLKKKEPNHCGG